MTPLARRLGIMATLTAAGAAGVLAWVDRAIDASCREWRPEVVRGGGPALDRDLSRPRV